jgi:hypothetical protein
VGFSRWFLLPALAGLEFANGHTDLAGDVRRFLDRMPAVKTEREWIAHELQQRIRDPRIRDQHPTR